MPNLLFICSKNQWRSPTAGLLFKDHPIHIVRSAGTSEKARIKINQKLIDWADVIFFMERRHKEMVSSRFQMDKQQLVVLDIRDDYVFGDPALIAILKTALAEYT